MRLRYKNAKVVWEVIVVIAVPSIITMFIIDANAFEWSVLFYSLIGIFITLESLWKLIYKYVLVTDVFLQKNKLIGAKKINLNDIRSVRNFAGDYTLTAKRETFTIDLGKMHPDDIPKFKTVIDNLKLDNN